MSGVQRAADQVQSRLQGGVALLAAAGTTAPFVGLFGDDLRQALLPDAA